MPRRREVPKREILPDPRFGDVVLSKFMNSVMLDGKKSVAERIVYGALDQVQAKTQQRADSDSLQQLPEQIEPAVRKVRHRDLGGKELCSACEEEHAHGRA